ncbi:MAG: Lar family restriction alleviation protein [Oscillospiraceae bacterium]|nr:Lar family restriction alleviation protein [Oscillospiraceae bacterium]
MIEVKKCPYCDSAAKVEFELIYGKKDISFFVRCQNPSCRISTAYSEPDYEKGVTALIAINKAVDLWNTRQPKHVKVTARRKQHENA